MGGRKAQLFQRADVYEGAVQLMAAYQYPLSTRRMLHALFDVHAMFAMPYVPFRSLLFSFSVRVVSNLRLLCVRCVLSISP